MLSQRFSALILLIIATMTVTAGVITFGILPATKTLSSQGNINTIGVAVYLEPECLNPVDTINWGYLDPGETKEATIYIKNEGTVPMTLNMTTSGWNPSSAESYFALSWNREGSQVEADAVLPTVLTLDVSPSITGVADFSFNITIAGSE